MILLVFFLFYEENFDAANKGVRSKHLCFEGFRRKEEKYEDGSVISLCYMQRVKDVSHCIAECKDSYVFFYMC